MGISFALFRWPSRGQPTCGYRQGHHNTHLKGADSYERAHSVGSRLLSPETPRRPFHCWTRVQEVLGILAAPWLSLNHKFWICGGRVLLQVLSYLAKKYSPDS